MASAVALATAALLSVAVLPPAPAQAANRAAAAQVLVGINAVRAQAGCVPLTPVRSVAKAAQRHTNAMVRTRTLSHRLPGEAALRTRLAKAGYRGAKISAEVLGLGMPTAASAVAAWMDSPQHRAILTDCRLRTVGVGIKQDSSGRRWWAINFARR